MRGGKSQIVEVVVSVDEVDQPKAWEEAVRRVLGIGSERPLGLRLVRRSIDARQRHIKFQLRFEVAIDGALPEPEVPTIELPSPQGHAKRVVVVGCGPAGLFAGLRLLQLGLRPVIVERGKEASLRRFDLAPILRKGVVFEDSNYCFGEGGAGTFSDGKLYTRAKKRGPVSEVYEALVAHGAPSEILIDAHPHIGSNRLPKVVMSLRRQLTASGGEVRFETRVTDFMQEGGRIRGVVARDGREIAGDAVILATGHSARDIYWLLQRHGLLLERKPFAMGMRIEHPQGLIDQLQYRIPRSERRPVQLPAASYQLATTVRKRGVHSFCMCPGGFIVPASTSDDEVVVNGMSLSKRDSPFANSGFVVSVHPEDTNAYEEEFGPLAGLAFQRELERKAKAAGGGGQRAPAQRVCDFIAGRASESLPSTSYFPGVNSARLDQLLPPSMVQRLQKGLQWFGQNREGYAGEEGLLVGFETRTSSPLRVPRDEETLQHPQLDRLFPCGEGAGYAGGIVSAALDGRRCAEAVAQALR